jgi:hypothetical protein
LLIPSVANWLIVRGISQKGPNKKVEQTNNSPAEMNFEQKGPKRGPNFFADT